MEISLSHKTKQFFWLILKIGIVFGCGYFIYRKLINNSALQFASFYQFLIEKHFFSFQNISILFLLSILNWYLEITKWTILVNSFSKINFKTAAIQSLSSLTVSLLTPNKIGEYGAKAIYFEKHKRKRILALNAVGNLHQLFITLFIGVFGFSYFYLQQKVVINTTYFLLFFIVTSGILILCYVLLIKFKRKHAYLIKLNYFLKTIPNQLHLKIGGLSFFRYLIFSHQFYFLLLLFSADISYMNALSGITTIYFLSVLVPLISLFDLVLKGSIALWVFSFFNINIITILSASTIMWVFNFVFPAILGSNFVLTFRPKYI